MGTKLPSEPSAAMLNLSALAYLLGVTVITWCITRATEKYSLLTKKTWTTMPWVRMCFLLVLLDTWLFLIMTGVLLHGALRQHDSHRCSIGITLCLICYSINKGLVYLCLIERVRAVWSSSRQRWRSPAYLFCVSLILPSIGIFAGLAIPQTIHYVDNGYCVVGINQLSAIILLTCDICIHLFLTGMFVAPLMQATIRSAWLRAVAIRSTIASLITLISASVNCVAVYVLKGDETIWVCFGGCAADIVIGTVVLYWALQGPGETCNSRDKSVYLSPIGGIPTFQLGTLKSIASSQDHSTVSHDLFHQDNTLEATVAVSHVSIPSLEKPRPAIQSLRHQAIFVRDPSRKRLSLPLIAEKSLSFRDVNKYD